MRFIICYFLTPCLIYTGAKNYFLQGQPQFGAASGTAHQKLMQEPTTAPQRV